MHKCGNCFKETDDLIIAKFPDEYTEYDGTVLPCIREVEVCEDCYNRLAMNAQILQFKEDIDDYLNLGLLTA